VCGICGVFDLKHRNSISENQILRMRDIISHRGPDGEGIYISKKNGVYLGHRRLKIIDLSDNGHQPMSNEDNSIFIVFNGEIYNFQKLRKFLIKKGHIFKSKTDTEVLIHLYEENGINFLKLIDGMFSFVIWDSNIKKLFVVRDRLGIKPLYYAFQNSFFYFASEIKSIIASGNVPKKINYRSVESFLKLSYIPTPSTIFENIYKLEPGNYIEVDQNGFKKNKYWDLNYTENNSAYPLIVQNHNDYLKSSIKSHLISDAPLGAFLSGGIDSTIIVSEASKILNQSLNTFTIGFSRASNTKDVELSRLVSKHFSTQHNEYILTPDINDLFNDMLFYLDEPFSITSAIPLFLNAKLAKKKVDVVLSGDGADEIYAGYRRHLMMKLLEISSFLPISIRKSFFKALVEVTKKFSPSSKVGKTRDQLLKKIAHALENKSLIEQYKVFLCNYYNNNDIYSNSFLSLISESELCNEAIICPEKFTNADWLAKILYYDIKTNLVDEMISKVDRMTMANSLEARVPFLDHKLVEFVYSLSNKNKINGITPKYLLKDSFQNKIPKSVITTPKRGFNLPIDEWVRNEMRQGLEDSLCFKNITELGIFKYKTIENIKNNHLERKQNNGPFLWSVMVLVKWLKMYS
jgi:asparagine synthase (glutamine-hydrolysing)